MKTIEWTGEELVLLDVTKLPTNETYIHCTTWEMVGEAISALRVRGAPAIGVAAAYGMILAAMECYKKGYKDKQYEQELRNIGASLAGTRPTAVNLQWAIDEILSVFENGASLTDPLDYIKIITEKAKSIELEDKTLTEAIGRNGAALFKEDKKYSFLTHCNTGALATAGIGTAFGVFKILHEAGKVKMVYADESRPLLQGARLTATELLENDIPGTLLTDSMAAYAMKEGLIDAVIVGADRITANGDVANKIGTYGVAVCAAYHHVPFYVAAPFSTFDFSMEKGADIPIEMRNPMEVLTLQGVPTAPQGINVLNPAFDVTPHELITGIITEMGVLKEDFSQSIKALQQKVEAR